MTYAEREEIFSKEYLSISDIQKLLGLDYNTASTLIRTIKLFGDRLKVRGKIHIQDYLDYYHLDGSSLRYSKQEEEGN